MVQVIGVHGESYSNIVVYPTHEEVLYTVNVTFIFTSRNSLDNTMLQSPYNFLPTGGYVNKHSRHCALSTAILRTKT